MCKQNLAINLTHNIHQQLLASLSDAPESHVNILLAWQAVHAIIQGVWHCFGHLKYSTTPSEWGVISHNNLLHNISDVTLWGEQHLQCKWSSAVCCNPRHYFAWLLYIYSKQYIYPRRAAWEESVLPRQENARQGSRGTQNSNAHIVTGKNVYTSAERQRKWKVGWEDNVTQISLSLGSELPAPASADSPHLRDEPEPDGLRGSAWRSPPWRTGLSPASQPPPEALWCWPPRL